MTDGLHCPHCGTCLDAPDEGCERWGLLFGHPFTSRMELRIGDERYQCRECGGEWMGDRRKSENLQ